MADPIEPDDTHLRPKSDIHSDISPPSILSINHLARIEDFAFQQRERVGSGSSAGLPAEPEPSPSTPFSLDFSVDPKNPMFTVQMNIDAWSKILKHPLADSIQFDFRPSRVPLTKRSDNFSISGWTLSNAREVEVTFKAPNLLQPQPRADLLINKICAILTEERILLKIDRPAATDSIQLSTGSTAGRDVEDIKLDLLQLQRGIAICAEAITRAAQETSALSEIVIKDPPLLIKREPQRADSFDSSLFLGRSRSDADLIDSLEVKGLSRKLADMGGNPELKEQIERLIMQFKDKEFFQDRGLDLPRGVLLYGPPGTGKTLAGEIIASEVGRKFYKLTASDFITAFYGESEKKLEAILSGIKEPCIVFIDEVDSIGENRERLSEPSRRVLNKLLEKMDGFGRDKDIIFIAATNRKDALDPALTRPGRFDRHIFVGLPDAEARQMIFDIHIAKSATLSKTKLFEENIDSRRLASESEGLVGADIEEIIRRAKEKIVYLSYTDRKDHLISTDVIVGQIAHYKNERRPGVSVSI